MCTTASPYVFAESVTTCLNRPNYGNAVRGISLFVLSFVMIVRISWKLRYMAQGLYMESDEKGRYYRLFIDGKMMLKLITTKYGMKMWTRYILLHIRYRYGSCECGNKPPDSVKGRKLFNSAIVNMPTRTSSWQ